MKKAPKGMMPMVDSEMRGGSNAPHGKRHDGTGYSGAGNPLHGSVVPPTTVGGSAPGAARMHNGNGLTGAGNPFPGAVVPPTTVGGSAPGGKRAPQGYKSGGKVEKPESKAELARDKKRGIKEGSARDEMLDAKNK